MKTNLILLATSITCLVNARLAYFQNTGDSTTVGQDQKTSSVTGSTGSGGIIVKYFDIDTPETLPYHTCILTRNPDRYIESIQVTTLATCYTYSDKKCESNQEPLAFLVTPLLKVPNAFNIGAAVFQSFICFDISDGSIPQHFQDPKKLGDPKHLGMILSGADANSQMHM